MLIEHARVTITTVGTTGACTVYTGGTIRGYVVAIKYEPGTLDTLADLTITGETTGVAILTKANAGTSDVWFYPRAFPNQLTDGAAGTSPDWAIPVFQERIKLVVAQGGGTTSRVGYITYYTEEEVGRL